jgi:hypothetical protein
MYLAFDLGDDLLERSTLVRNSLLPSAEDKGSKSAGRKTKQHQSQAS